MLYDVSVSRTSTATRDIRVEADSAEEAEAKALAQAGDEDFSGCVVEYEFDTSGATLVEGDGDDPDGDDPDDDEPQPSVGDLECFFCGAKQETVEAAIEAHWIPSFFVGEEDQSDPVCAACARKYLMADESGEDVLKPEYAEGQYVSVWESGGEFTSYCIVNVQTREVEVFKSYEKGDDDRLVEEYVMVGGVKCKAAHADDRGDYAVEEQARMFFWK